MKQKPQVLLAIGRCLEEMNRYESTQLNTAGFFRASAALDAGAPVHYYTSPFDLPTIFDLPRILS